jgi:hypothetical protein
MKNFKKISVAFKNFVAILMLCMLQTIAFAQDKKVDVDISTDKGGGDWYAQPWVWIVGGAVFLLLLVALMRNNSNRD